MTLSEAINSINSRSVENVFKKIRGYVNGYVKSGRRDYLTSGFVNTADAIKSGTYKDGFVAFVGASGTVLSTFIVSKDKKNVLYDFQDKSVYDSESRTYIANPDSSIRYERESLTVLEYVPVSDFL